MLGKIGAMIHVLVWLVFAICIALVIYGVLSGKLTPEAIRMNMERLVNKGYTYLIGVVEKVSREIGNAVAAK